VKFRFEQEFSAPLDAVEGAFCDPALYAAFGDLHNLAAPEVLEHRVDGPLVHLKVRYRFTGDLSAAARRVIDPARLTWVDVSTIDRHNHVATYVLEPDHYRDRFRCHGNSRFEPADGDRTRRVVDGDLTVRFPLVGGAVERAIVSGLRDHLDDEVAIVERWVSG
jgi:hypothetical protein